MFEELAVTIIGPQDQWGRLSGSGGAVDHGDFIKYRLQIIKEVLEPALGPAFIEGEGEDVQLKFRPAMFKSPKKLKVVENVSEDEELSEEDEIWEHEEESDDDERSEDDKVTADNQVPEDD